MAGRKSEVIVMIVLALWLALPTAVHAGRRDAPADDVVCTEVARQAARDNGVPLEVMLAVARVESGRSDGSGGASPWPWTINAGGEGGYFATRAEAEAAVAALLAEDRKNVDIGCFQVNYNWHGENFPSVEAMFDPVTNADYAARLLAAAYGETGDWVKATGIYHSRTPDKAETYMAKIENALEDPSLDPGQTFDVAMDTTKRQITIAEPLADWFFDESQGQRQVGLGSLVVLSCSTCLQEP